MLKVENLSRSFGARTVLRDVSFELPTGVLGGLIGPGGSGKSVLLKVLGGIYRPGSGGVQIGAPGTPGAKYFDGAEAHPHPHSSLSLMFQEGALFDSLSVYDNVAFPLVGGRVPSATLPSAERDQVHVKVTGILARVGLLKAAHKLPGQLSGGMRKRVSLARALVAKPQFVFLDDPTAGLDPVASSVIMNLIVELHHEYRPTALIVSQDLRRLLPVVETLFALFEGKIVFHGGLSDLQRTRHDMLRKFVCCRYDLEAA